MSSNTQNIDLLKKNPITDGNDTFNIKTILNDNWDKVDEAIGKMSTVPTTAKDAAGAITELHEALENIDITVADGSITDTKIGTRTIDDTVVAAAGEDTPTRLWSKLANMIKSITGKPSWFTAPTKSLEALNTEKVDKVAGKGLSTEDYTSNEKAKLSAVAVGANNYTHPANHPPSIIAQDTSNRFVTDTEKTTWNAKASTSTATTGANGLMSSADKTKLDGVATGAGTANSATDTVIGNRTVNDAIAVGSTDTDTPTNLFSRIGAMIRAITGKADWYTAPVKNIEQLNTAAEMLRTDLTAHTDAKAPHSATSAATPERLMLRDGSGRVKVAAPAAADDAARLDTVTGDRPVIGTYTGNGVTTRDIALPFTPSAVFVMIASGGGTYAYFNTGLAVAGVPSASSLITIGTNKFTVTNSGPNTNASVYNYIALR